MNELLVLEGVSAGYGDSVILEDISLTLQEGESIALLGRNGVGKTSLLITLMGLTKQHAGKINWCGRSLVGVPSHRRAQAGLGWVPQERGMFASLTVHEHLTAVARSGPWNLARVYQLFPRLQERRNNGGNQLSGGEQQMLAIARALMINPRLLLLDETMEGLAPIIVQDLLKVLQSLVREEGMSVIIVEQHARMALSLTHRAIILDRGRIVHEADSRSLIDDTPTLTRLLGVA
jgi:branched-chain amino acid transport system ATP-binding protein